MSWSAAGATRRQLLVRGGAVAGTAALPSALLAAPALAQETAETDALENLVELEQAAELAYSLAAEELSGAVGDLLRDLGTQAGEHATALGEASDQLGVDPPEASEDTSTYPTLRDFDEKAPEREQLDFFATIEEELVLAYENAMPELEAADLVVTCAQVGAAHAQALVALRLQAGTRPDAATVLPEAGTADGATAGDQGGSAPNGE